MYLAHSAQCALIDGRGSACDCIDGALVERSGRALCDWENEREHERKKDDPSYRVVILKYEDWRSDFDSQARVALAAALNQ